MSIHHSKYQSEPVKADQERIRDLNACVDEAAPLPNFCGVANLALGHMRCPLTGQPVKVWLPNPGSYSRIKRYYLLHCGFCQVTLPSPVLHRGSRTHGQVAAVHPADKAVAFGPRSSPPFWAKGGHGGAVRKVA